MLNMKRRLSLRGYDGVITRFSNRGRVLCCEDGAYRRGPRWRGTQAGEKEIHLKPAWPFVVAVLLSSAHGSRLVRATPNARPRRSSFSGPTAPG